MILLYFHPFTDSFSFNRNLLLSEILTQRMLIQMSWKLLQLHKVLWEIALRSIKNYTGYLLHMFCKLIFFECYTSLPSVSWVAHGVAKFGEKRIHFGWWPVEHILSLLSEHLLGHRRLTEKLICLKFTTPRNINTQGETRRLRRWKEVQWVKVRGTTWRCYSSIFCNGCFWNWSV